MIWKPRSWLICTIHGLFSAFEVRIDLRPGSTRKSSRRLATFTAATVVRRGLMAAGFEIKRVKGFRKKREMLAGVLLHHPRPPYPTPWFWRRPGRVGHSVIVGAGIAGLAASLACSRAGLPVHLMERAPAFQEVGAGIQLGPNVTRLLQRWGIGKARQNPVDFL